MSNARITFSITNTPADKIPAVLRSFAAKVDIDALAPGSDITLGDVRVQVATPQVSDIRAYGLAKGYTLGTRGRYPAALIAEYDAYVKAEKAARAAERKAAREAKKALVSA